MPNATRSAIKSFVAMAIAACLLLAVSGCTPAQSPKEPAATGQPAAAPPGAEPTRKEVPAAAPQPAAAAPGTTPPAIPPALEDLKAKLQPPGLPAAKGPEAKTAGSGAPGAPEPKKELSAEDARLVASAEKLALDLAKALDQGDFQAAAPLFVNDESLGKVLTPGYKDILAGSLVAQNKAAFETYAGSVRGKGAKAEFKPGEMTQSPAKGAFISGLRIMSGAVLVLTIEGVPVQVRIEQLAHHEDKWQVVRLGSP